MFIRGIETYLLLIGILHDIGNWKRESGRFQEYSGSR